MIASFNEDSPSSKCQSDNMIQRSSGETKERRDKTNKDRKS